MRLFITTFLFSLFCLTHVISQIEEAPVVEEVPDVEVVEIEEAPIEHNSYPPPPPPEVVVDARGKSYQYQKINENYSFYFRSTSAYINYITKVGIMKKGKSILPMIFSKVSNSENDVILSLGKRVGIFNIETDKWVVPLKYMSIRSVLNGFYSAQINQNEFIIIDKNNRQVSKETFRSVYNLNGYDNYVKIINQNNLQGIYNFVKNEYLIPPIYKTLDPQRNIFIVQNENNQKKL